ncbi:MAG: sulfite exporter TauE/SafE family protein [Bacteroidetes bacterium]|nr:sulfite exporter TauE/SafE family protein [Bacteroidota bacterium]
MDFYILIVSFFIIALIYSSVGFGGGTSYLALLAVMSVSFELLRPTALLCNIVVVTSGTIIFYKEGLLDLKKNWPFLLSSVPMAFLGGYWPMKQNTFFVMLGFSLIVAAIFLWFQNSFQNKANLSVLNDKSIFKIGLGGGIGFLSGMVSIGGGIFLSPVLHLLNWDQAKKISALASVFILVNSISGLAGQLMQKSIIDWNFVAPLLLSVFIGGQIGSRLGAKWFNEIYIKRITALLIFAIAFKVLQDHW